MRRASATTSMGGPTCRVVVRPTRAFIIDDNILPSTVQATTRLVAFPHGNMLVQIGSVAVIGVARFAPAVSIGLSSFPVSPDDHFETSIYVFVATLKLGMSPAAPVSVSKVVEHWSCMCMMVKELLQCTRFHKVEFIRFSAKLVRSLIAATNMDINI